MLGFCYVPLYPFWREVPGCSQAPGRERVVLSTDSRKRGEVIPIRWQELSSGRCPPHTAVERRL